MISTGGKLWFAAAALAAAAAGLYWLGTGRGEWFGTFVLASVAIGAFILGFTSSAMGDADVDVFAPSSDAVPVRRTLPAIWPPVAALGGGFALVGLAGKNALLYVGLGVLAIVLVEWMVQNWAERATGDHATNRVLRDRLMAPFEIPLIAIIVIAFVVLCIAQVFLALPKTGTIVVAGVVASAFLLVGALVAARPRVTSTVLTGLLAIAALAVLVGGIAGLAVGPREFHPHEDGVEAHDDATEDQTEVEAEP